MSRPTSGLESTNNQYSTINITQSTDIAPASSSSRAVSTVHDFTGAIVKLQVNDVMFKTHESRISKFASLNQLIEDSRRINPHSDTLNIAVHGDDELVSDFLNTFELLNAPQVEPVDFSSDVLVSAARISAAYNYPVLRAFSIKQLEELSLSSIECLRIGRALGLESWEERACKELSERNEMITKEEMLALGTDAYFQVASTREQRQRDRVDKTSPNTKPKQVHISKSPGPDLWAQLLAAQQGR